ncbi:MAG: hydroxysqualene dehydroxylase HpnE [Planctomycetota bacterium]
MTAPRRIVIIGGGLAGMAAAVQLIDTPLPFPCEIQLLEAKRQLGGRAGSFVDRGTSEAIDHCQHVAMGCCDQFLNYCQRTATTNLWQRHSTLHFFGVDGRRHDLAATPGLPAPLHLATSLLRMSYLSWRSRWEVCRGLGALWRLRPGAKPNEPDLGTWLRAQGQSEEAIERFWSVTVVSALSETVERTSLAVARKLFVDGFMRRRDGYQVLTPRVALSQWHQQVADWLRARGVEIRLSTEVQRLEADMASRSSAIPPPTQVSQQAFTPASTPAPSLAQRPRITQVWCANQTAPLPVDAVISAVPWYRVSDLVDASWREKVTGGSAPESWESGAIASLHLWFDRPLTELPHAVFIGRRMQWIFAGSDHHHYQVVISAAHALVEEGREQLKEAVLRELHEVWPAARTAQLVRWRMLLEPQAVFAPRPGHDLVRPAARTGFANLWLAGDWTATGWPATMESAIRSGYEAATESLAECRAAR